MAQVLIRQFDVFRNPSSRSALAYPFVVVLQSDWIADTSSVIVAPLVETTRGRTSARFYPEFEVEGRRLALAVSDLASIERSLLTKPVPSLDRERDRIVVALDLLFTGY